MWFGIKTKDSSYPKDIFYMYYLHLPIAKVHDSRLNIWILPVARKMMRTLTMYY
jgi:hypothetical protein